MRFLLVLAAACLVAPNLRAQHSLREQRSVGIGAPERRELAGKRLTRAPWFDFVRTFNRGDRVEIGFDGRASADLPRRTVAVFVVLHDELDQFLAGRKLQSVTGPPLRVSLSGEGVHEDAFVLDAGTLQGIGRGTLLGRGYDVIVDADSNGVLDGADLIDGGAESAGFYVVDDFVSLPEGAQKTGPYDVVEVLYSVAPFLRQDVYYPANIAELGLLPLVVVSHGNGHSYLWYDHIGYQLASWGYIVMSHRNNTGPGPETAATTTLRNTNHFIFNHATISPPLEGHVDSHKIVWIGHSRGGEGVVRAYRRLLEGDPIATTYGPADVRLVSSIAPVDFYGPGLTDVGSVTYSLWTGGADADVNGCADCDVCQTFHLHERADGERYSISLHGAGHGDFHDGGGDSVASGPCLIGRADTHAIMRGYLLPLVQHVIDANPACKDYLWRQWEGFRPLGAPAGPCVVVDLMAQASLASGKLVLDDFQTNSSPFVSSSGGRVSFSVPDLTEGVLDDGNLNFNANVLDPMNGMTLGGPGDVTRGLAFAWHGSDAFLLFEVPPLARDLTGFEYLSFRAAQATRDPATQSEAGDLDFTVELRDSAGRAFRIAIGAYSGGIEEPYQRGGCGTFGQGWANEFETIRIRLTDFQGGKHSLDLGDVVSVGFLFGPSHGSPLGRIGLDELEFTRD